MNTTNKLILTMMFVATSTTLQATCVAEITPNTPSSDFTTHNDGTVTHTQTGLMWKVCSETQNWSVDGCSNVTIVLSPTWLAALQAPQNLNSIGGFAGYSDWRLPNIKELGSLVELACSQPAIEASVFPSTANTLYWSSTPDVNVNNEAWFVNFGSGRIVSQNRSFGARIRLVRGGQ